MQAESMFRYWSLAPDLPVILGRLADLKPTLGLMHGSSFQGDGALQSLEGLRRSLPRPYLTSDARMQPPSLIVSIHAIHPARWPREETQNAQLPCLRTSLVSRA
jgi:hypothetical protein